VSYLKLIYYLPASCDIASSAEDNSLLHPSWVSSPVSVWAVGNRVVELEVLWMGFILTVSPGMTFIYDQRE
jgi:hypothetical protein